MNVLSFTWFTGSCRLTHYFFSLSLFRSLTKPGTRRLVSWNSRYTTHIFIYNTATCSATTLHYIGEVDVRKRRVGWLADGVGCVWETGGGGGAGGRQHSHAGRVRVKVGGSDGGGGSGVLSFQWWGEGGTGTVCLSVLHLSRLLSFYLSIRKVAFVCVRHACMYVYKFLKFRHDALACLVCLCTKYTLIHASAVSDFCHCSVHKFISASNFFFLYARFLSFIYTAFHILILFRLFYIHQHNFI